MMKSRLGMGHTVGHGKHDLETVGAIIDSFVLQCLQYRWNKYPGPGGRKQLHSPLIKTR
jgi:hypothetical protein